MKFTNKEKSSYLIWVAINLFVLLVFGELSFGNGYFYPLSDGFEEVNDYDISEFMAYTIIPLLIIMAVKLGSSGNDTE
jgi:hypothetical protein